MNPQDHIETFTTSENISKWGKMAKLILFMKVEKEFESAGSCRTKYIKKKKQNTWP